MVVGKAYDIASAVGEERLLVPPPAMRFILLLICPPIFDMP